MHSPWQLCPMYLLRSGSFVSRIFTLVNLTFLTFHANHRHVNYIIDIAVYTSTMTERSHRNCANVVTLKNHTAQMTEKAETFHTIAASKAFAKFVHEDVQSLHSSADGDVTKRTIGHSDRKLWNNYGRHVLFISSIFSRAAESSKYRGRELKVPREPRDLGICRRQDRFARRARGTLHLGPDFRSRRWPNMYERFGKCRHKLTSRLVARLQEPLFPPTGTDPESYRRSLSVKDPMIPHFGPR